MSEYTAIARKTLTDTTERIVLSVRTSSLSGVQWVQTAGAGSATISFYASAAADDDARLDDIDPATNPFWSLTPIAFAKNPAGVPDSDYLPIADNGVATLLMVIVVTGTVELSVLTFLNPAQVC